MAKAKVKPRLIIDRIGSKLDAIQTVLNCNSRQLLLKHGVYTVKRGDQHWSLAFEAAVSAIHREIKLQEQVHQLQMEITRLKENRDAASTNPVGSVGVDRADVPGERGG